MALNNISGRHLTIFSLNFIEKKEEHDNFVGLQYMSNVRTSKNLNKTINQLTKKYFGDNSYSFPSILFFEVDNEKITDRFIIELHEEKIEETFFELKDYIKSAAQEIKKANQEKEIKFNKIFDKVELKLKKKKLYRKFKRVSKDASSVIGFISSITGLIK